MSSTPGYHGDMNAIPTDLTALFPQAKPTPRLQARPSRDWMDLAFSFYIVLATLLTGVIQFATGLPDAPRLSLSSRLFVPIASSANSEPLPNEGILEKLPRAMYAAAAPSIEDLVVPPKGFVFASTPGERAGELPAGLGADPRHGPITGFRVRDAVAAGLPRPGFGLARNAERTGKTGASTTRVTFGSDPAPNAKGAGGVLSALRAIVPGDLVRALGRLAALDRLARDRPAARRAVRLAAVKAGLTFDEQSEMLQVMRPGVSDSLLAGIKQITFSPAAGGQLRLAIERAAGGEETLLIDPRQYESGPRG